MNVEINLKTVYDLAQNLCFCGYLLTAAWNDLKTKSIPCSLYIWFGATGMILWLLRWCSETAGQHNLWLLADLVCAAGIGGVLLLISAVTSEAVGTGDGCFFIVSAVYLGFWKNFELFLGGLFLCALYGLAVNVKGMMHNRRVGGRSVPFIPFLIPIALGVMIWQR